jgi:hypothetical protein
MSRSSRSTSICGVASAPSEKADKQRWHRRFRQRNRQRRSQGAEPLPLRAVSNLWTMAKDGKHWFDAKRVPHLMRK